MVTGHVFASIGESKRTLATRLTTVCKGLRLFCKALRLFCKHLRLFCKHLCGNINSQRNLNMFKISLRQEKLFATIKTVCELVCNLLRTITKPKIRYVRKHSPLSVIPPLMPWSHLCVKPPRVSHV